MKLSWKPVNDVIVIKNDDTEKQTEQGLFIPTDAQDEPSRGEILGYGHLVTDPDVEEGRKVIYKKYAGHKTKIDNQEVVLVPFEDVLLVERDN